MKRILLFSLVLVFILPFSFGQTRQLGVPYFRNYTASDYDANNRNSDIVADNEGRVFIANFEGLLYYDQATWRMLHLRSLTRPTSLYLDSKNTLWVGGYNYFGHVVVADNGTIGLKDSENMSSLKGEVLKIWEEDGHIVFLANNDRVYRVNDNHLSLLRRHTSNNEDSVDLDDTQTITIDNGLKAVAKTGSGLFFYTDSGELLCNITEKNGLCSNNINRMVYNGKGLLWGVTDNGVFSMSMPTAYTYFSHNEGVQGEVYSMHIYNGLTYVGTTNGLYRQNGMSFEHIEGINHLCWALTEKDGILLVASEGGLYSVDKNEHIRQINEYDTKSILVNDDVFITGEGKGVFLNKLSGERYKISPQQNVTQILKDGHDCMWLKTIYGEIWYRTKNQSLFSNYTKNINKDGSNSLMQATLVKIGNDVVVVDAIDTEPFLYPQFSYTDFSGNTWLTDKENNNLYVWKNGQRQESFDAFLYPLRDVVIRTMFIYKSQIWLGGESGVTVIDRSVKDPAINNVPKVRICSVIANGDSVVWGGFGECPKKLPTLESNQRNIYFTFAIDNPTMLGRAQYKYRMDDHEWSAATDQHFALFNDQRPGEHVFQVKAVDAMGREIDAVSIKFEILAPFYIKWYMNVLYLIVIAFFIYLLVRYRISHLEREKLRLESVVNERTAEIVKQRDEIVKQKDEIEEKSRSLESALDELGQAQNELIRQEKMAMVGKLTQGLIDRILNPLNYINNFAKLSIGLVKDVKTNIDDEKEHMSEDNYEDTVDVLGMLSSNLEKVGEHGQNTTRTLKAMEEMLKDRSGGIVPMNLAIVLRQNEEMFSNYYAKEIAAEGIKVTFNYPSGELPINGNAEMLSKCFMSMLANSVYAILKKSQREKYKPEITFSVTDDNINLIVTLRDNGIGIEETILNKVFDPFFTTKPTGEASGVGLYLSREIIQNHQGDISVKSVKNEYTEFTIVLPKNK